MDNRRAATDVGVLLAAALATNLTGCGSNEDLVLGHNDFVLQHRDDFDAPEIDLGYWELASHTFEPNLAWFSPANAKIEDGQLLLTVSRDQTPTAPAAGETPKPFAAAELRSRAPFLYGRFRARAKLAPGVGVVSAFWGFYDRYAMSSGAVDDNQIVTEAASTPAHTLRYSVSIPTDGPKPTQVTLDFDLAEGFHELGFDWTPSGVRFFFDGEVQSAIDGEAAARLTQYQRLVLSAYPTGAAWAGTFDADVLPVSAAFDWVEVWSYSAARP